MAYVQQMLAQLAAHVSRGLVSWLLAAAVAGGLLLHAQPGARRPAHLPPLCVPVCSAEQAAAGRARGGGGRRAARAGAAGGPGEALPSPLRSALALPTLPTLALPRSLFALPLPRSSRSRSNLCPLCNTPPQIDEWILQLVDLLKEHCGIDPDKPLECQEVGTPLRCAARAALRRVVPRLARLACLAVPCRAKC